RKQEANRASASLHAVRARVACGAKGDVFMQKRVARIVATAIIAVVMIAGRATAQAPLGFTIDSTEGLPGSTVSGQVDPQDVAANCVTDLVAFQARFAALLSGPFVDANTVGDLPQRFFPDPDSIVYENTDQLAYVLTLFLTLGLANDLDGAAQA